MRTTFLSFWSRTRTADVILEVGGGCALHKGAYPPSIVTRQAISQVVLTLPDNLHVHFCGVCAVNLGVLTT